MIAAMRRTLRMVLVMLGLCAHSASAQPSFELSGGYALGRDPRDEVTLKTGWIADAAGELTPIVSAVAEASGQYATIALLNADARLSMHTVMAGARASARLGRLTEFAQLLTGVAFASGSAFGSTTASRSLAIQPGVGVDCPLARAWAARAQFDVRLIRSQPDATNGGRQFRFAAALVYRARPR